MTGSDLNASDPARRFGLHPHSPFRDVLLAASATEPPPPETRSALDRVDEALDTLRRGGILALSGMEFGRSADLVLAGQFATAENLGFLLDHTSGLLGVVLSPDRAEELDLQPMVAHGADPASSGFTVSVDARVGTGSGMSLADRAVTIRALAHPGTVAADLRRPGHVVPQAARRGGVLDRAGAAEAAADLMSLAGLSATAVLCPVASDDAADVADADELHAFATRFRLTELSVDDVAVYRRMRHGTARVGASTTLPTPHGRFTIDLVVSGTEAAEVVVLRMGDVADPAGNPLVRIHSECLVGDAFGSRRCDCGAQLDDAFARIAAEGSGAVLYVRGDEARGILGKLRDYAAQDAGGPDAELGAAIDARGYDVAAETLHLLGVRRIRLLTRSAEKVAAVRRLGIEVDPVAPR